MTAITLDPKALADAGVELKVTKQDLIDLVKETLEERLEEATEDFNERFQAHCVYTQGLEAKKLEAFKKEVSENKDVKAYIAAIEAADKLGLKLTTKKDKKAELRELTIEACVDHGDYNHEKRRWERVMRAYIGNGPGNCIQNLNALSRPVLTNKECEDLEAINLAFQEEQRELHKQSKDLKSSTRSAKMAVVRAALGNSDQGKALLGILDSKSKPSAKALATVAGVVEDIKVESKSKARRVEVQKAGK